MYVAACCKEGETMHTFSMHGSGQANQVCHVISPPSLPPYFKLFLLYVTKAIAYRGCEHWTLFCR